MPNPVIIPCGAAKVTTSEPVEARHLYTGSLFKALWACAITLSDEVYILSAGYGLLHPCDLVLPYNVKMTTRKAAWLRAHSPSLAALGACGHLCPTTYAAALPAHAVGLLPPRLKMGHMMAAAKQARGPVALWEPVAARPLRPLLPPPIYAL